MTQQVSDFVLAPLRKWGVHRVLGYPGDGINSFPGAFDPADGDPLWHAPGTGVAPLWHAPGTALAPVWHVPGLLRRTARSLLRRPDRPGHSDDVRAVVVGELLAVPRCVRALPRSELLAARRAATFPLEIRAGPVCA